MTVVETNPTAAHAVGSIDPLFNMVDQLEAAMNYPPTAHKMLAMCLPETNILKHLRRILLSADTNIPSTFGETVKERYITLCNTLGTVPLIGMSYPLLAVLNVVDLLRYWHKSTTPSVRRPRPPKQGADENTRRRTTATPPPPPPPPPHPPPSENICTIFNAICTHFATLKDS